MLRVRIVGTSMLDDALKRFQCKRSCCYVVLEWGCLDGGGDNERVGEIVSEGSKFVAL